MSLSLVPHCASSVNEVSVGNEATLSFCLSSERASFGTLILKGRISSDIGHEMDFVILIAIFFFFFFLQCRCQTWMI